MACVSVSQLGCATANQCPDCFGCVSGVCPDFQIKQNDTRPPFKVSVSQNDEPMDLTGLVIEANMWANAKLKSNISDQDMFLALANNVGFCQILPNDIILMDRARGSEQMKIIGFNETCSLIQVERGFNGTVPQFWKRGTPMKIFRFRNAPASSEMIFDDITQVDGTVDCNVLTDSFLVYDWNVNDTCIPGCFSFEFKVLKMSTTPPVVPSVIPDCFLGVGVEWTRRFPGCGVFTVQVCPSPTAEISIPFMPVPLPSCIPAISDPVCPPACGMPVPVPPTPPGPGPGPGPTPTPLPVLAYSEVTLVPSFGTTTVVSYFVTAPKVSILGFIGSGTVNAWFKLQVNGVTQLSGRSTVSEQTIEETTDDSGIIATAGQTVTLTAIHEVSGVLADFEGTILGVM
jgi:hypothetical protein